jgi:FMN phosphatase YigB (HAD superfamily)
MWCESVGGPREVTTPDRLPDRRFTLLDAAIRSSPPQVISADCFDTLLWRQVPKPTDLHLLVGERLHQADLLDSHIIPTGYAKLRILAEEEARRRKAKSNQTVEVALGEIHAVLAPAVAARSTADQLASYELEVERESLFIDLSLSRYLRQLLEDVPAMLIVVSDTYFSGEQLRAFLGHRDLEGVCIRRIFTSSDHGTGKGDRLWETVISDLGVAPDQIAHLGDNLEADVMCAGRAGIRAFHYPTSTERFVPIEIREGIGGRDGYPSKWCDAQRGDGGITAIRRRSTFGTANLELAEDEQVAWETGAAVFGPVFTGFAQWVLEQSEAGGAARLLFLMREGRFLKDLVDRAIPLAGWRPTTATLWVSREACARASIYQGSETELHTFLERLRPPTPRQLVDSLGLDPIDIPDLDRLDQEFAVSRDREALATAFLERVQERPPLVEKMIERSAGRRSRLTNYLRRTAGPGAGPIGLVDVGWSGSIQESLQSMFAASENPVEFRGFYLLAHVGSSDRVLRGTHLKGYLGTVGTDPFDVAAITGGAEIIELVSTCEEGSLLEIGQNEELVLAPAAGGRREQSSRELVQQGVRSYQQQWLQYHRDRYPFFETSPAGVAILTRILKRFVSQPNHDEALAFNWWIHEENYGSEGTEQLVPPRYLPTLRYRSVEDLHWAPMSDLHWTGGAAALVDNELSDAIFLMREGVVDPGRFSSPKMGTLRLSAGSGASEIPPSDLVEISVVRNRHGLSLVEWRGPIKETERLVLWPAESFMLLRLDLIEVVDMGLEDHPRRWFGWSNGEAHDNLPASGVRWVTSQVMAVDGDSRITIDLAEPLTSREIRVTLAGAFLPSPLGHADTHLSNDPQLELAALRGEIDNLYRTKVFRLAAYPRRVYGVLRRLLKESPR